VSTEEKDEEDDEGKDDRRFLFVIFLVFLLVILRRFLLGRSLKIHHIFLSITAVVLIIVRIRTVVVSIKKVSSR